MFFHDITVDVRVGHVVRIEVIQIIQTIVDVLPDVHHSPMVFRERKADGDARRQVVCDSRHGIDLSKFTFCYNYVSMLYTIMHLYVNKLTSL